MGVGTTVWVDDDTRASLRRLQASFGTDSVNATIRRLIEQPAPDARAIFAAHRDAIRAILLRHRVHSLIAFGSRARGDATPGSDLDLAVHVGSGANALAVLSAEADLEAELGIPVDVVELPNPRLEEAIKREGVVFEA